jgi:hypothetical protein
MSELSLCVVTMLRDDYDFLEKWVQYYGNQVNDLSNLYVISHGENPRIRAIADGCSILTIPHFENGSQFEPRRRKMFFGLVAALRNYFENVLVTDVDEFVVVDPALKVSLAEYLRNVRFEGRVLSPLGFDLVHKPSVETKPFDFSTPVTKQRRHGYLEAAYTKPCVFREAPVNGGNAHFINDEPWHIDRNLILFHMKYFDRDYGRRIAERRLATVLDYEMRAKTHRIGGWHNRAEKLATTIERIETETVAPLTGAAAEEFAVTMRAAFEARKTFPWDASQRGPFVIPDRYIGTV